MTVSHCACVTSNLPISKSRLMRTRCTGPSSASPPADPIWNSPAGIGTIPLPSNNAVRPYAAASCWAESRGDHNAAVARRQLVGVREDQVGDNLQGFEVVIRLIEAVEEHQAIGAGPIQAFGHVGHGAEVGSEFHGHRDGDFFLDGLDQVDVLL